MAREVGALAGHTLMFGFGFLPNRHNPQRARDIRTLVFVHGLSGNRAQFFPLQTWLKWKGHKRQFAYNYRSQGSIERLAVELKDRIDTNVKGGDITIVAHSMGGLVSRAYLQLLGGDRRVDTMITLATPHYGSHAAAWMPSRLVSQLKPEGPFIQHLNSLPAPRTRCIHYAASMDKMVLPATSALGPFGEHRMLDGYGHLDLLFSPRVFREVAREVAPKRLRYAGLLTNTRAG